MFIGNVLGLFDGGSMGQQSLKELGIKYGNYYSSEIDKYAIKVITKNFPDTIHLGDVMNFNDWDLPNIDLLMGGSPCQDLSRIKGSDGNGLDGEKSKLFYTFFAAKLKFKPKYFLFENVVMKKEYEEIITKLLGVEPVLINSSVTSAQDRPRLYWTNIGFDIKEDDSGFFIKDVLEKEVDDKYYYNLPYNFNGENKKVIANLLTHKENGKRIFTDTTSRVYNVNHKAPTLTAVAGGHQEKKIMDHKGIRKLTPLEYERLQNLPDGYTDCVSNSQRYKILGNGWTIGVIKMILGGLLNDDRITC